MYAFVDGNRVGDKVEIYPIVYAEKPKRGVGSVSADDAKGGRQALGTGAPKWGGARVAFQIQCSLKEREKRRWRMTIAQGARVTGQRTLRAGRVKG